MAHFVFSIIFLEFWWTPFFGNSTGESWYPWFSPAASGPIPGAGQLWLIGGAGKSLKLKRSGFPCGSVWFSGGTWSVHQVDWEIYPSLRHTRRKHWMNLGNCHVGGEVKYLRLHNYLDNDSTFRASDSQNTREWYSWLMFIVLHDLFELTLSLFFMARKTYPSPPSSWLSVYLGTLGRRNFATLFQHDIMIMYLPLGHLYNMEMKAANDHCH